MREWIDDFKSTVAEATGRLQQIDEAKSTESQAPGKWSAKEILGHLIDSAANNHSRFVLAQMRDDLVFPGYEQNKWIDIQKYRDEPWPALIDLWRAYNVHIAHVMEVTPDDKLKHMCIQHTMHDIAWRSVSENTPVSLEHLMRDYVEHLKHHLDQIFSDD